MAARGIVVLGPAMVSLFVLACSTGGDADFSGVPPQPGGGDSHESADGGSTGSGAGSGSGSTASGVGSGTGSTDGSPSATGDAGSGSDTTTATGDGGTTTTNPGTTGGGTPSCGDGVAEGPEACDGSDLGGQTCANFGFSDGVLVCNTDCSLVTDACFTCGDGTKQTPEVCDDPDFGGEDCVSQGFGTGSLACASDCGSIDTTGCQTLPSCGDGNRNGTEQCEGTDYGGATCQTLGWDMGALSCNSDCTYNTSACQNDNTNCVGFEQPCIFDPNNPQGNCCPPGVMGNMFGICNVLICV